MHHKCTEQCFRVLWTHVDIQSSYFTSFPFNESHSQDSFKSFPSDDCFLDSTSCLLEGILFLLRVKKSFWCGGFIFGRCTVGIGYLTYASFCRHTFSNINVEANKLLKYTTFVSLQLKVVLAPCIETLILLDRLCYLKEQVNYVIFQCITNIIIRWNKMSKITELE